MSSHAKLELLYVSFTNLFVSMALVAKMSVMSSGTAPTGDASDVGRFYAEVGRRIREARMPEAAGGRRVSQNELAQAANLTRTSIANIERGRQKVLLHTLVAFAETLSVEPGSLIPRLACEPELPVGLDAKERRFVESVLKPNPKQR